MFAKVLLDDMFCIGFRMISGKIDVLLCLLYLRVLYQSKSEPRGKKTGLQGFQPGPTQTGLYTHKKARSL